MGLSIQLTLTKPPGRDWYTSLDSICGIVRVRSKRPVAVSSICVYLEGQLKTAIKPCLSSDTSASGTCNQKLFSRRAVVFEPGGEDPQESKLVCGNDGQCFLFSLEVPLLTSLWTAQSAECPGTQSELPPSFSVSSSTLHASASYRIKVVLTRPGFLQRNRTVCTSITLRPLQPPAETLQSEITEYCTLTEYFPSATPESKGTDAQEELSLPPYSPALTLSVGLPANKIIHAGSNLDIRIALRIPEQMQRSFGPFWLSNLTVRVQARTTARISDYEGVAEKTIAICSCEGCLPLDSPQESELFTIPADLWQHYNYPFITPSFACVNVRRSHRLQISLKLASASLHQTYDMVTSVDVIVESGPTASPSNAAICELE